MGTVIFSSIDDSALLSATGSGRSLTVHHEATSTAIPIRFLAGTQGTKSLVISFHGNVDRMKRPVPVFPSLFPSEKIGAHQLAISDPSLLITEGLRVAWYSGHPGFNTQEILPALISQLRDRLKVNRLVFHGGSSGGFAAMLLSHKFPGSIAVAANPATAIFRYYRDHVEDWLGKCFGQDLETASLPPGIVLDLGDLYSSGNDNLVTVIQSMSDHAHLHNHLYPFLARVRGDRWGSFAVNIGHFGSLGHTINPSENLSWLLAAQHCKELSAESIIETRYSLGDEKIPQSIINLAESEKSHSDDFVVAEIVKESLLGHEY